LKKIEVSLIEQHTAELFTILHDISTGKALAKFF
jgi:hypothetical protein